MPDTKTPVAPERDLLHPLERLRGIIYRFVTVDVILFVLLFLSFWFWLGLAVDYGAFKAFGLDIAQQLTPLVRYAVAGVLLVTLLAMIAVRVATLFRTELSDRALALVLEKRYPTVLEDRLITAIEMADVERVAREGYSADLVRNTIREARERIGQVDVRAVFNWGRLWKKAGLLVGLSVVGIVIAFAAHALAARKFDAPRAGNQFADVASIWAERNVLMWKTPWPRRALVQIVEFDDDGHPNELRVGKGAAIPPKVAARAYKWVVADRTDPDGWRPLTVADLPKHCNLTAPAVSPAPVGATTIDDLELTAGQDPAVQDLLAKLEAVTDDLKNTRKVRKLIVPSELTMRYDALQSKARMYLTLNRDATGRYASDVAGLSESVRFQVSAEDFTTARRQITLVPPPTFIDLYRDEYQPAYLHHAAPALSAEELDPKGPLAKDNPLAVGNPQYALRGLRQAFPGKRISITSDKSVFSVPIGTELTITAQADKPLKRVELKPVSANVPTSALLLPAQSPFDTFKVRFGADNPIRQTDRATEFQLVLTDTDNVSSTRTIAIQATDDAPPAVDVIVDPVIRRVGGYYYVTPVARIPFLPESKISDDTGLTGVRFEFKKTEEEAVSVVQARAMDAAAVVAAAATPFQPSPAPAAVLAHNKLWLFQYGSGLTKDASGNDRLPGVSVPRFSADDKSGDYDRVVRHTLSQVRKWAADGLPADLPPQAVKAVKLSDAVGDAFDLQRWMPDLLERKPGEVQPRYKVELFVVAKDGNVELVGKDGKPAEPKTAKNLDPIRLQVVSEQDLLAEVAKDEEQQMTRMEDVMKKATDGFTKLEKESSILTLLPPQPPADPAAAKGWKDQLDSSAVRATDIQQDVNKVRDILSTMRTEYDKLYRELDTNRCGPNVLRKYQVTDPNMRKNGYLDILKRIFDTSLPKCEQSLAAYQSALATARRPSNEEVSVARTDYLALNRDLAELQTEIGIGQDLAKGREELRKIIAAQQNQGKNIKEIEKNESEKLFVPNVSVPRVVQVQAGKTVTTQVSVEWRLYDKDEAYIAIDTPADSGLTVPKEMTVKSAGEELTKADLTITAGMKPGLYTVTLRPGPFKKDRPIRPVELTVEVTK
jgi:hypothetical protein